MVAIVVFSFALVIYRLPLLKSRHELDSWVSREAAFLANNWILLFSAFFILFATMFPTLSEAVRGAAADRRAAVLQHVDAADRPDAARADRHRAAAGVAQVVAAPTCCSRSSGRRRAAIVTGAALAALGVRVWSSGICFALCAFVAVHHSAGVRARRARAARDDGHRLVHRDGRPGGALAPPLRRLHRPSRASCSCSWASPARATSARST